MKTERLSGATSSPRSPAQSPWRSWDLGLQPEALRRTAGEDEPEVKELVDAAEVGIKKSFGEIGKRLQAQDHVRRGLIQALL